MSATTCEVCGAEATPGAAYCSACGHRLGTEPPEPVVVNVHVDDSSSGGCLNCLTWAIAVVVLAFFVVWLFSC